MDVGKGMVYLENTERCYVIRILQGGYLTGEGKKKETFSSGVDPNNFLAM